MGSYGQHSASVTGVVSTASYVAVPGLAPNSGQPADTTGVAFRVTGGGPVAIVCENSGANSIDVKLQGSNDPALAAANWADLTTTELTGIGAAAAKATQLLACGYLFLQLVVKDTAGGSHGTLNAYLNQNPVS